MKKPDQIGSAFTVLAALTLAACTTTNPIRPPARESAIWYGPKTASSVGTDCLPGTEPAVNHT